MMGLCSNRHRCARGLAVGLATLVAYGAVGEHTDTAAAQVENMAQALPEGEPLSPTLVYARTLFRRKDFMGAMLVAGGEKDSRDATWITAESLYRLRRFAEAQQVFASLSENPKDPVEARKIAVRLFDCAVSLSDVQAAVDYYLIYKNKYKRPAAIMSYALGKKLFDIGEDKRAAGILAAVPKGSDFYMRARYLIAAMGIATRQAKASVKLFSDIEKLTPISVEDYSVKQMAILAQGRIFAGKGHLELAEKAYDRVLKSSEFGVRATLELARAYLAQADLAYFGEGEFNKIVPIVRADLEAVSVKKASEAIERYRKVSEIDWRKPELLGVMAYAFVRERRYDEARIAYEELIGHYRPLVERLADEPQEKVWPVFEVDKNRDPEHDYHDSIIFGVPNAFFASIEEVSKLRSLRARIEHSARNLEALELQARRFDLQGMDAPLQEARTGQSALEDAFKASALELQKHIAAQVAKKINEAIAEADFRRGELAWFEMQDRKKEIDVVQKFQLRSLEEFDKNVKKMDGEGSS